MHDNHVPAHYFVTYQIDSLLVPLRAAGTGNVIMDVLETDDWINLMQTPVVEK